MRIHLLYFRGCPYLAAARVALYAALAAERVDAPVEEIDIEGAAAPAWSRGWASPTILIDGVDVYGQAPAGAPACRRYPGGGPGIDAIRARIVAAGTLRP